MPRALGGGAAARRGRALAGAARAAQHLRILSDHRRALATISPRWRQQLDRDGYRPGKLWAPAISVTQLVGGPLLALGLFTRPAALAILMFLLVTNVERWRVGKYFWNQLGLEYTLMWTVATFYFLVHGGGRISLDHLIGRAF